jgi:glycosyltransferase involved in cell wall biosynthesis
VSLQVTVNGRFLTRSATGVDRFAIELLRRWLPKYGPANSARVVVPSGAEDVAVHDGFPPVDRFGKLSGHAWEQLELPARCRGQLLLSLCNTGPMLVESQLCVLHDAGAIFNAGAYSFAFRTWYRVLIARLMRKARIVATVSEFSASELRRHFGKGRSSLEVIYESGEHILQSEPDEAVLKRLGLVGQPYILCVGSQAPHKNFVNMVRAAALLTDMKIKCVAAGGANKRIYRESGVAASNLIIAGYVSDAELRALYENALCFVFPSLYEGFGLPPLEAMNCGCPVLVSARAALPEVCGEGALYCDPEDPKDIAAQLRTIVGSERLRAELRERGRLRAASFTWTAAADKLQHLIAG